MPSILLQPVLALPPASRRGALSLEATLAARRSVRSFEDEPLELVETAQLAWAAAGRTGELGRCTTPSAGGSHPLEVLIVAGRVQGLAPGVYHYRPAGHELALLVPGDRRAELAEAALDQDWVREAPLVLVLAAVPERTILRYGRRGRQYVLLEAGHASQSVLLQAVALGLGSVPIGAFDHERVASILGLFVDEEALLLLPVGRPRAEGDEAA